MMFTRKQFDQACKAFIRKHDSPCELVPNIRIEERGKGGWSWREHARLPGFGFMERNAVITTHRPTHVGGGTTQDLEIYESVLEPADEALAPPGSDGTVVCYQYVVLSPTFQVPTFYFSVHDSGGVPLSLSDITQISLFRQDVFEGAEMTAYSIGQPSSNFPLLSFGDHPSLGTSCWFLHPCETGSAISELLAEKRDEAVEYHVCWLEAWFVILGSVVDLVA